MNCLPAVLLLVSSVTGQAETADLHENSAPVRGDLHLTDLLQHDVQSIDDRRIGAVRDVVISDSGSIEAVIVDFDHDNPDSSAAARMEWSDVALTPESTSITVSVGRQPVDARVDASTPPADAGLLARKLIGMPVNLKGTTSFGRIDDLLVDAANERISALLVSTSGGKQYALPMRNATLHPVDGYAAFDGTREEIEAFEVSSN